MSDRPWWTHALQWGLWAVAMAVVMGWLGRSRRRTEPATPTGDLQHPLAILIIGLVGSAIFVAFAVLAYIYAKPEERWVSAFFLLFVVLCLPLLLDYFNARHTLRPDGLQYGRLLGGGGVLHWRDVRKLHYSQSMKWFRLEAHDGRVARISAMMMGLPEFAQAALAQVRSDAIDDTTRPILEATARGELPSVWSA